MRRSPPPPHFLGGTEPRVAGRVFAKPIGRTGDGGGAIVSAHRQMEMAMPFRDRSDAGQKLAVKLGAYAGRSDVVIMALAQGGVPVAVEVAAKDGLLLRSRSRVRGRSLVRELSAHLRRRRVPHAAPHGRDGAAGATDSCQRRTPSRARRGGNASWRGAIRRARLSSAGSRHRRNGVSIACPSYRGKLPDLAITLQALLRQSLTASSGKNFFVSGCDRSNS